MFTSDKPHYENVPFEIPDGWCWTTIEDVCSKIGSGSTPKGSNYSKEGIPFFRSQNVQNDGIVLSDIKYISDEVHQSMIGTEVVANDLLLNITGGSLGRCAVVPRDFDIGNVSQHVCILRTVLVKPEYLHCFILSSFFSKSMKITGSGREGLPKYNLEKMLLPLPPIQEQERIIIEAKRLQNNIDKIDTCNGNLVELISQTKSKVLDLAIHGKLVPQDPTDEPASELLKRINPKAEITCDNGHYQKLPEGWCECKLSDVCVFDNGYAFSSDNYNDCGIPLIRISNITNTGSIDLSSCVFIQDVPSNKFIVKSGDLLIAMSGATTGKMGVYLYEENALLNQRVGNLKCTDAMLQQYRNYYMFAKSDYILKIAYGGAQPNISAKAILDIDVMLPPLKEQHRIVAKIEEIFAQLDAIEASL